MRFVLTACYLSQHSFCTWGLVHTLHGQHLAQKANGSKSHTSSHAEEHDQGQTCQCDLVHLPDCSRQALRRTRHAAGQDTYNREPPQQSEPQSQYQSEILQKQSRSIVVQQTPPLGVGQQHWEQLQLICCVLGFLQEMLRWSSHFPKPLH